MLCHKSIAKLTSLLRFQYPFAFNKESSYFALVSIVTLYNMCCVPVSVQCISRLNHLAHSLLHDHSAWVYVKIGMRWSLSKVESDKTT